MLYLYTLVELSSTFFGRGLGHDCLRVSNTGLLKANFLLHMINKTANTTLQRMSWGQGRIKSKDEWNLQSTGRMSCTTFVQARPSWKHCIAYYSICSSSI